MKRLNKKGIALILVISSLAMLSLMMVELTSRSQMNIRVSNNFINAIKARELARSGIYFAALELKVYKEIREHPMIKSIPGFNEGMLDMIWKFGFIYPPLPSKKTTFGAQKAAKELVESSKIDGKIHVEIIDESAKINLNDLGNPKLREGIAQQIEAIFDIKKQKDEVFFEKYRDLNSIDLIDHIIDWIDKDNTQMRGGDENSYYSRLETPYRQKNAPLDTVSELALIEGFDDDEIFNLLLSYVTVYPTGGINVNTADATLLMSINPELTEDDVKRIIDRREKAGHFKDAKEFEDFCKNTLLKSSEFNKKPKVPLTTRINIFSLVSTAEVKGTSQTITAVVDISKTLPDGSPEILYWNLN